MTLLEQQVRASLQAYLDRGEKALQLLKNRDWDRGLKLLKKRKAAFHNFRVASELSTQFSEEFSDRQWQRLFDTLKQQDETLMLLVQEELQRSGDDLAGLRREKSGIGNYKAVKNRPGSFKRFV